MESLHRASDPKQFRGKVPYSLGSIRNQVVHMRNMEDRWFSALRGIAVPGILNPVYLGTQAVVQTRWDEVEMKIRAYLAELETHDLRQRMDEHTTVWQALFHVLNHGTDHRAQTLAMLSHFDVDGFPQDYYRHLVGKL